MYAVEFARGNFGVRLLMISSSSLGLTHKYICGVHKSIRTYMGVLILGNILYTVLCLV